MYDMLSRHTVKICHQFCIQNAHMLKYRASHCPESTAYCFKKFQVLFLCTWTLWHNMLSGLVSLIRCSLSDTDINVNVMLILSKGKR